MRRNITTVDDFVFVPFERATTPPGGHLTHHKDKWWVVHPDKGVCYYQPRAQHGKFMAAQHNSSEVISRMLLAKQQEQEPNPLPGCEVRFIPSVFERLTISDYV